MVRKAPLKCIIADDHLIVRQGIESLLKSQPAIHCVAVAANGDEVLPLLDQYQPDLLLIDLSMPGKPTLEIIRHCHEAYPNLRIIVLTMYTTPFAVTEVFRVGAHAFVAKDEASNALLEVIQRVASGEEHICNLPEGSDAGKAPYLAPRELRVLHEIALSLSIKEISDRMGISNKTVELYRTRLLRKFGLTKATELMRLALESGIQPKQYTENKTNEDGQ